MDSSLKMDAFDSMNDDEYCGEEPKKRKPRKKLSNSNAGTSAATPRNRHKSGAASYADLITKAILSNNDSRLSLAEIYDWMATNVASLQAQRYLHSSKGWKNAVRHTLSINPRFLKVARMGRPSWWTVETDLLPPSLNDSDLTDSHAITPLSAQWVSHTSLEEQEDKDFELSSFRNRSGSEPAYYLSSIKKRRPTFDSLSATTNVRPFTPVVPSTTVTSVTANEDDNFQKVKIWQNDGTVGYVTIASPVMVKTTTSEEMSTQTDDAAVGFDQTIPSEYVKNDGAFNFDDLAEAFNEHPFHFIATMEDNWQDQAMESTDDVFKPDWFENH